MLPPYETDAAIKGAPDQALSFAEANLSAVGFRIGDRSHDVFVAEGPGLRSTRQNPLLGATRIAVMAGDRTLRINAELGGIEWMRKFVLWFPLLLGLFLGLMAAFLVAFAAGKPPHIAAAAILLGLLPVSPWIVIGPMMIRSMRRQTERAFDTLVQNAAGSTR